MAASVPRYNYIISKWLDPLFALTIGVSAAAVRIRREEREQGRSMQETFQKLKIHLGLESAPEIEEVEGLGSTSSKDQEGGRV